jgi:hypothetical protein
MFSPAHNPRSEGLTLADRAFSAAAQASQSTAGEEVFLRAGYRRLLLRSTLTGVILRCFWRFNPALHFADKIGTDVSEAVTMLLTRTESWTLHTLRTV